MKFSSISLIAAGLAIIAGSTVAAPGPLYARALLVDDNLFRRQPTPNDDNWRNRHLGVAGALLRSSLENNKASVEARITANGKTKLRSPAWWQGMAGVHDTISTSHCAAALKHLHDALQPQKGPQYPMIDPHYHAADVGEKTGKRGSRLAEADRCYD